MNRDFTNKGDINADNWFLILHNDEVNSQMTAFLALCDCTKMEYHLCDKIMMTAHHHESAIVMTGSFKKLFAIQSQLKLCNLATMLVQVKDRFSIN